MWRAVRVVFVRESQVEKIERRRESRAVFCERWILERIFARVDEEISGFWYTGIYEQWGFSSMIEMVGGFIRVWFGADCFGADEAPVVIDAIDRFTSLAASCLFLSILFMLD